MYGAQLLCDLDDSSAFALLYLASCRRLNECSRYDVTTRYPFEFLSFALLKKFLVFSDKDGDICQGISEGATKIQSSDLL